MFDVNTSKFWTASVPIFKSLTSGYRQKVQSNYCLIFSMLFLVRSSNCSRECRRSSLVGLTKLTISGGSTERLVYPLVQCSSLMMKTGTLKRYLCFLSSSLFSSCFFFHFQLVQILGDIELSVSQNALQRRRSLLLGMVRTEILCYYLILQSIFCRYQ